MTEYERNQVFLLAQTGHNLNAIATISGVEPTECSLLVGGAGVHCMTCLDGSKDFEAAEAAIEALEMAERSVVKNPLELDEQPTEQATSAADSATSSNKSPKLSPKPIR